MERRGIERNDALDSIRVPTSSVHTDSSTHGVSQYRELIYTHFVCKSDNIVAQSDITVVVMPIRVWMISESNKIAVTFLQDVFVAQNFLKAYFGVKHTVYGDERGLPASLFAFQQDVVELDVLIIQSILCLKWLRDIILSLSLLRLWWILGDNFCRF